jgi:hypothetical protein
VATGEQEREESFVDCWFEAGTQEQLRAAAESFKPRGN